MNLGSLAKGILLLVSILAACSHVPTLGELPYEGGAPNSDAFHAGAPNAGVPNSGIHAGAPNAGAPHAGSAGTSTAS